MTANNIINRMVEGFKAADDKLIKDAKRIKEEDVNAKIEIIKDCALKLYDAGLDKSIIAETRRESKRHIKMLLLTTIQNYSKSGDAMEVCSIYHLHICRLGPKQSCLYS
jgi:hypothetical protein